MTKIIGVNGFKRSGKGETGEAVARIFSDSKVKQVGFADKLKIIGAKALGFVDLSDQECIDLMDEAKESWRLEMWQLNNALMDPYSPGYPIGQVMNKITGREYLQHLGNQARKVFGESFWIDQVLPPDNLVPNAIQTAMNARYPGVDYLVITDLRYENEARRIKALGGVVWEVLRPGAASDGHDSEQTLPRDLIDWQIYNDGSLWQLEQLVKQAILGTVR